MLFFAWSHPPFVMIAYCAISSFISVIGSASAGFFHHIRTVPLSSLFTLRKSSLDLSLGQNYRPIVNLSWFSKTRGQLVSRYYSVNSPGLISDLIQE